MIRKQCQQLEDRVDLRRRRFHDQPAIEATAALHFDRVVLDPPLRAPPAIRNAHHGTTSQVRSLFSSASRSLLPFGTACCAYTSRS